MLHISKILTFDFFLFLFCKKELSITWNRKPHSHFYGYYHGIIQAKKEFTCTHTDGKACKSKWSFIFNCLVFYLCLPPVFKTQTQQRFCIVLFLFILIFYPIHSRHQIFTFGRLICQGISQNFDQNVPNRPSNWMSGETCVRVALYIVFEFDILAKSTNSTFTTHFLSRTDGNHLFINESIVFFQ